MGKESSDPIIIDGPATSNYDEDLGVLPLSDRYYDSIYSLLSCAMHDHGPSAPPNNVLINGTMVEGQGKGAYQRLHVEAGKKYRLRFVNSAMDHLFRVSLDGHAFTVIQADFVPVKPYQTTDLQINVGQRYDVIFEQIKQSPTTFSASVQLYQAQGSDLWRCTNLFEQRDLYSC
jgi:FtsP/CotA-like multicopper oxidase with cupredoxin domain